MTQRAPEQFWTVDDLAARQSTDVDGVLATVRAWSLPFMSVGRARKNLRRRDLRFNPETVRGWEAEQERVLAQPGAPAGPAGRPGPSSPWLAGFEAIPPRCKTAAARPR